MASNELQETLDRILADLKSDEASRCLNAIQELGGLNVSSRAILMQLEQLALKAEDQVRQAALRALSSRTSQYVASQRSTQDKLYRSAILQEIDDWQKEDILDAGQAEVLRRRYDFDLRPATHLEPAPDQAHEEAPASGQVGEKQLAPPGMTSTGPRPSLTETLLSEASIKVYLYLGAFFVIASALILAALVEAARLPILAVATVAFGGAALVLRRRLPQPSFALLIVFSFLLPIDANVLEETIGLGEPSLSTYWTAVFLLMSVIWGASVWFYESRFFSAVAFVALSLAFYRFGAIFDTELELQLFLGILACLAGLGFVFLLKRWRDETFARPLFWLAQVGALGWLAFSIALVFVHEFDPGISRGWWVLTALTWLLAASFYVLSDVLQPSVLIFPWLAGAVLLPLPWFLMKALDIAQPDETFGFWLWGAVFAAASEAARRRTEERTKRYHLPLLAGSLVLFLMAFSSAFVGDQATYTFAVLALIATVYGILHWLHPRSYVWSAALFSALLAYFTFFQVPGIRSLDVPFVYQLLAASLLLLVPELFTRAPLSLQSESRLPALIVGILVSASGLALALADFDHTGRSALVLIIYTLLLTLHAIHGKREWLGYFAAATEALALLYALDHFNLDLWLPALTLLGVIYYGIGSLFRRMEDMKSWGNVLVNSGLAFGVLLSLASLIIVREASGWYVIVVALLFAVEVFARPFAWLELAAQTLLSIALFQILGDFNVNGIEHFLFGASLIWWGGELIFARLMQAARAQRWIQIGIASLLISLAAFSLLDAREPRAPATYFFLYAVFFAAYAFLKSEPRVGYLVTAFLSLAIVKFAGLIRFEEWMFPLIALAVLYYAAGFWARQNRRVGGWDEMLLFSGLGLGVATSIAAPFQGGLGASIPVALAATLFAAEAFARRDVWWALPADMLYLMSYFIILIELEIDEPQYYSVGAALLGMLMHVLLTRAGGKTGAFVAGMLSQIVLLGTTYIQMLSTGRLSFFIVLFVQSMLVLVYGLIQRSRSLVITPMAFAIIAVMTVVYSALKGLGPVILIGSTGLVLLMAGIVAVLMRERITKLGEQLSDWKP